MTPSQPSPKLMPKSFMLNNLSHVKNKFIWSVNGLFQGVDFGRGVASPPLVSPITHFAASSHICCIFGCSQA